MCRVSDSLDLAVEATADAFRRNPADFSDERALATAIGRHVNAHLPPARVDEVVVEESSAAREGVTDHEAYTARYRDTTQIDAGQCEVGGPRFPFGAHERLDLGVFDDGVRLRVVDGTQQYDPRTLIGAVACKYVKNTNYLRYRPDDGQSTYADIASDVERLGLLADAVDRRCVVFANYDLCRGETGAEAERRLRATARDCGVDLRFVTLDPHPDFVSSE